MKYVKYVLTIACSDLKTTPSLGNIFLFIMYIWHHFSLAVNMDLQGRTVSPVSDSREDSGHGSADALRGLAEELVGGLAVAHAEHGASNGATEAVVLDKLIKALK